jgi:hypothetical protein
VKTILYNSGHFHGVPPSYRTMRFQTRSRTNWHYEAAALLAAGTITV